MYRSFLAIQRIAFAPFDADAQRMRFVVDTSDDNVSLAAGVYVIVNEGSVTAYLKHGGAASVPTDKAALAAGYGIAAGAAIDLVLDATTALHAITESGSATLCIMKKVV